jgi:dihydrolipoamide dehydrogenase
MRQITKEAWKTFAKQKLKHQARRAKIGKVETHRRRRERGLRTPRTNSTCSNANASSCRSVGCPIPIGLGGESVGLKIERARFHRGRRTGRTSLANVWAVGDVVRARCWRTRRKEEGVMPWPSASPASTDTSINTVPWVIYTSPEIAWVGRPSSSSRPRASSTRPAQIPFLANGRARALGDTTGMVRSCLATQDHRRSSACTSSATTASELIAEAVVAMEFKASAEDIARICHAHPTLSEATQEAALAVDKRTLNF